MTYRLESGCFECLTIASQMRDGGYLKKFLTECGDWKIGEDSYAIAWDAISQIFERFSLYCKDEDAVESLVFSDPVISECARLCMLNKAKNPNIGNAYWEEVAEEVSRRLSLNAYDYDWRLYDGSHGCARLVLLTWPEFYGHCELPEALIQIRDTFQNACRRLRQELGMEQTGKEAA